MVQGSRRSTFRPGLGGAFQLEARKAARSLPCMARVHPAAKGCCVAKGKTMLINSASFSPVTAASGAARDPTMRATPALPDPGLAPQPTGKTMDPHAVQQSEAGLATGLASLRARLSSSLPMAALAGPPPTFQTSVLEDLRRELKALTADRGLDRAPDSGPGGVAQGQEVSRTRPDQDSLKGNPANSALKDHQSENGLEGQNVNRHAKVTHLGGL